MHNNVVLLIGGERADLPDNFDVLFNCKQEELSNPTVVKNSYSKTVALPGTANNNKIFGFFFRSDRMAFTPMGQVPGAGFDASKRIDFQLFVNASLEESGYLQLNDVTRNGIIITYNCTLYGGLGDFLYTLTKSEKGNPLLLADLDWGIDGAGDPETEMDFNITKEAVASAWTYLNANSYEGTSLWDTINFIPMNEGVPDGDFSADKVLINTLEQNVFPTSGTGEQSAFTTYHNYALGTLDGDYDWLATRDLRSYHQRPCFKIKRFFDAISNPDNNGGYQVQLDPAFFNPDNPYFADAYATLPALGTGDNSEEILEGTPTSLNNIEVGSHLGRYNYSRATLCNGPDLITDEYGTLDLSQYAFGNLETYVDFQLTARTEYTGEKVQNTCGIYDIFYTDDGPFNPRYLIADQYLSFYFVQLVLYNANTNVAIDGSNIYCFGTPYFDVLSSSFNGWRDFYYGNGAHFPVQDIVRATGYHPEIEKPYVECKGGFYYDPVKGCSVFRDEDGFNEWRLYCNSPKSCDAVRQEIRITKVATGYRVKFNNATKTNVTGPQDGGYKPWDNAKDLVAVLGDDPYDPTAIFYNNDKSGLMTYFSGGALILYDIPNTYSSGARITKRKLLSLEATPADVLLSYIKMFGLVMEKDKYNKIISIRLKNTHYTGEIVDIADKIDYSKPFNITPVVLTSRYYNMQQDTPETYYSKMYKDNYGAEFGSQKINTNSNFDSNITELYDGNVFTNLVTARGVSRYNANYFDKNDNPVPAYAYNGVEVELYENGDVESTTSIEIKNIIDYSKTENWFAYASLYDFMDRPVSYTLDGGEKKNVDSKLTLLFFNGMEPCLTGNEDPIKFWLTDDVGEMMLLNDGRCWIYTNTTTGYTGTIALEVPRLPIFSRYSKGENPVSFDFGTPREVYTLHADDADNNIYKQYWKNYLTDQFNANTRMVSCYVKLDRNMYQDALRKFYYFDNALWVLNEIQDYSVTKDDTTKCVFIKVQDANNYTSGQTAYTPGE